MVYPFHLALAALGIDNYFNRPEKPANFSARTSLYLTDLLEKDGYSLDTIRRILWKNAVRLPIQEVYDSDKMLNRLVFISCLLGYLSGLVWTMSAA